MANIMRLGGGGGGKAKKLLSSLTEGSLVSVLEDGKLVPFYVAKHDYEADLNGEGRTLLVRKNLHSTGVWDAGNVNTLVGSDIDIWLNNDYKLKLSAAVQASIAVTKFYYTISQTNFVVSTLQRDVFLLSGTELGLTFTSNMNVEGEKLPVASLLQMGYLDNGTLTAQFTRSPASNNAMYVFTRDATGAENFATCNAAWGRRPCFTLPATMALRDEPFADGAWGLADEDILLDTETASIAPKAGVTYTNGIANLDEGTLHEIGKAISCNPNITKDHSVVYYDSGDVHRKISVGDTMSFTYNDDKLYTHTASIISFNHDYLSGNSYGSATATGMAGLSFQMVECLASGYPMNSSNTNNGGWTSCVMRNTYVPIFITRLTNELQSVIKAVNKLTSVGGNNSTITTTRDKLFLLSEIEIFGSLSHSYSGEGSQYAYYKAGNSKNKTYISGSATGWWERSPAKDSISFCNISNAGAAAGVNSGASAPIGVAFAFCI